MAEKILLPALSPTMETGTIASWTAKEGDEISTGDVLCEIETDKTTMDFESTQEGILLAVTAGDGAKVKVGDPIGVIGEKGEDVSGIVKEIEASSGEPPAKPSTSEKETKKEEGPVHGGKAPAEEAGHIEETKAKTVGDGAEEGETDRSLGLPHPKGVFASPIARKIASEKNIDLREVHGSGPGGRIVKRDIEDLEEQPSRKAGEPKSAQKQPEMVQERSEVDRPVSEKRKIIAQRLSDSFFTAPHFYIKAIAGADGILAFRERINSSGDERIGFNAFLMKMVALALRRNPAVNSSWRGDTIREHSRVDIALAVAQKDGLITPIVRGCDYKGIKEIDHELKELVSKAREGRLSPEEYTNSTFSISNLGSFGIREFNAIINPPEAAILGIGEIFNETVPDEDGMATTRRAITLTLGCDHRVLDGAIAARFLKDLKESFEDPVNSLI